jgi:hypothetical protein
LCVHAVDDSVGESTCALPCTSAPSRGYDEFIVDITDAIGRLPAHGDHAGGEVPAGRKINVPLSALRPSTLALRLPLFTVFSFPKLMVWSLISSPPSGRLLRAKVVVNCLIHSTYPCPVRCGNGPEVASRAPPWGDGLRPHECSGHTTSRTNHCCHCAL